MPIPIPRQPSTRRAIQCRSRSPFPRRFRPLLIEPLEPRRLLASDWQNPFNPRDVTGDGIVVPLDVLNAINELNNRVYIDGQSRLPDRSPFPNAPFYDFNGDGLLSATADVLPIINA